MPAVDWLLLLFPLLLSLFNLDRQKRRLSYYQVKRSLQAIEIMRMSYQGYSASKKSVRALWEHLGAELLETSVQRTTICPFLTHKFKPVNRVIAACSVVQSFSVRICFDIAQGQGQEICLGHTAYYQPCFCTLCHREQQSLRMKISKAADFQKNWNEEAHWWW